MVRIPLSLHSKLTIAFLVVLVPIVGLVIYSHLREYQRMREATLQDQLRTAEAVGTTVEAVLDQGTSVSRTLSIDPVIRDFAITPQDILQRYLARYLALFPEYGNVNVWGPDGRLAASATGLEPGEAVPNISDRGHFQRAMASGNPAVSEVLISRVTDRLAVAVASPIKDDSGRPLGVVTILLNLDQVTRTLRDMRLRQEQMVFATDGTGRLAFHTGMSNLEWEERAFSWYQPVREALAQGHFIGIVEGAFTSDLCIVTATRTHNYGWVAAISVPESLVLAPVQKGALISLAFCLGIVLMASTLALGLTYNITRPLGHLARTMADFGRGNMSCRAEVRTGDELEVTAETFNRMASALQQEQERLRNLVEMGTALASALDLSGIAEILSERSSALLGEVSCVCILPKERQECTEMALHAPDDETRDRLKDLFHQYAGWLIPNLYRPVLETREPLLIPDVSSSSIEEGLRCGLAEVGAGSLIVVPLLGRRRIVGVLVNLSLGPERRLGEDELALAMDLASRAGAVVDNALLFQQVQDEQSRLQTILDTTPVGVVVVEGPSGRLSMANRAARDILGRPSEPDLTLERWPEEYGLHWLDGSLYPPEKLPLARSLLERETVRGDELILRQGTGRELFLLVFSSPLPGTNGRPPGAVAAFSDITPLKQAQRRAEEAAREAERRRSELDAVIEGVGEGIIVADRDGRIVRANSRARQIMGLPDLAGRPHTEEDYRNRIGLRYSDGRVMPFEEWPLSRALRGEVFTGLEAVYQQAEGREFHLLFSSGVVRDEKGSVRLAVTIFGDITPIRELERAREEFISVVAHDLRSPLTVIAGFAGILRRLAPDQHGQPQEQKAVDSILSSAKRLERMVADLLDASRIKASRLVLAKETVDLSRLVEEVVERTVEITRGHPLVTRIHGEIPPLEADPARLEQVLTNLLSNAAKYSYPETEILIEVERRAGEAVVSVANEGPGISPEDQKQLFTRFRRTRAAAETGAPGLGLGLYITKGLVEAHGGHIWVESDVGKYTTFRFTLPLKRSDE